MNFSKMSVRRTLALAIGVFAVAGVLSAAENSTSNLAANQGEFRTDEVTRLKAQLAAQQKQLETLRRMMQAQQDLLENAVHAGPDQHTALQNTRTVASLTPVAPASAAAPTPLPAVAEPKAQDSAAGSLESPCDAPQEAGGNAAPPYLRLGSTCVIPIGFLDMTSVWRNVNAGSSIGTNFAIVPYNNVAAARNSEFRFSPQNSRLGLRVDGDWKSAHFIGYNEFDFLGTSGTNNLGITNGAFVPRLRLFWIDVRKNQWEFLAGQSWSMLTPNRAGISPLPADIFFSQVMDVNYLIGLTWTRQPGVRVIYHPSYKVALGVAFENPNQQIGGSSGAPIATLPSALTSLAGSQVDNASSSVLSTPNVAPDIIVKLAFDPSRKAHIEFAGLLRQFRIWNPDTSQHFGTTGAGVTWGLNFQVAKGLRVITNGFLSDGGGRYLFGTIPDFVVRSNGSISPIHADGTTDGLEYAFKNTLLFAYYGGAYAGKNVAIDTTGTSPALVGYGFRGAPNSQNRVMEEVTGGFNQTMWKSPRYGAVSLIGQYEYFWREPWYLAPNAPASAHDSAIYMDIRYTLPGALPNF